MTPEFEQLIAIIKLIDEYLISKNERLLRQLATLCRLVGRERTQEACDLIDKIRNEIKGAHE